MKSRCIVVVLSVGDAVSRKEPLIALSRRYDGYACIACLIDGDESGFADLGLDGWQAVPASGYFGDGFLDQAFIFEKEEFLSVCRMRAVHALLDSYGAVVSVMPPFIEYALEAEIPQLAADAILLPYPGGDPDMRYSLAEMDDSQGGFAVFCAGCGVKRYLDWCIAKLDYTLRLCNAYVVAFGQYPTWQDLWRFPNDWLCYATSFPVAVSAVFAVDVAVMPHKKREAESKAGDKPVRRKTDPGYPYGYFADGTAIPPVARKNYARNYRLRRKCAHDPFAYKEAFLFESDIIGDTDLIPLTPVMREIAEGRPDLGGLLHEIVSLGNRAPFTEWFLSARDGDLDLVELDDECFEFVRRAYEKRMAAAMAPSARAKRLMARIASKLHGGHRNEAKRIDPTRPQGVNLCGYISGVLGVGEAVRILADILDAGGIPFCIVECQAPMHYFRDAKWDHRITNEFVYNTNIMLTDMDRLPYFMRDVDRSVFGSRYNIGYWFWELEKIPEEWTGAFGLVDEAWTASGFFADVFAKYTEKPVGDMPLAVTVNGADAFGRVDFGIPEDAFMFLMSYDSLSTNARKNPDAAVRAFLSRFDGDESVRLVIKINAPEVQDAENALLRSVRDAANIDVIVGTFTKERMNALIGCCDAYVSLHRAEGFGLGPAEAMYLGKPAVLTNWSGNTEYMTPDNCCPVGYTLVEIEEDAPPYAKGNIWAEADVEEAAAYMERLVKDKAYYDRIAACAHETIRSGFSPEAIAKKLKGRLNELGLYVG